MPAGRPDVTLMLTALGVAGPVAYPTGLIPRKVSAVPADDIFSLLPIKEGTTPGTSIKTIRVAATPTPSALIVIADSPIGAVADAVSVKVSETVADVTESLLHDADTPLGSPETLREREPLTDPRKSNVKRSVPVAPGERTICHFAGLMLTVPTEPKAPLLQVIKTITEIIIADKILKKDFERILIEVIMQAALRRYPKQKMTGFGLYFLIGRRVPKQQLRGTIPRTLMERSISTQAATPFF